MELLKISKGNAKTGKDTLIFNLPSGYSCPHAHICLKKVDRITGKLKKRGKGAVLDCYSASLESIYPSYRALVHYNFDLLKRRRGKMKELIYCSLPKVFKRIRIHGGGGFFCQEYFDAWIYNAERHPDSEFYAYMKALPYWVKRLGEIPPNLKLIASVGGTHDHLITEYNLRYCEIVWHPKEAKEKGLRIDHDDTIAYGSFENFAVLLHGTQKAQSKAAEAIKVLKKENIKFSYNR